jgi:hypothetical protein
VEAGVADFEEMLARPSNRGRWGESDERGALDYLTEEKRASAARLVRRGRRFSLSIPVENGRGPRQALLLVAQGLPIVGGTGTPVNPLALK